MILGPQGEPLDLRFNEDQPRDPNGQFASGSGGDSKEDGPDKDGKWAESAEDKMEAYYNQQYPEAGATVDGRVVRDDVPNMSSISASLPRYLILDGVREVDFSRFDMPPDVTGRTKELAEEIKASGELNPLIVGVDNKGPYIMEGSHRYDALKILGAKSIPAVVVLDLDELQRDERSVFLGPQGEAITLRFNDDQPRDPSGKFASGGGEGKEDVCSKCGQAIKEGELVSGVSWNGEGGTHLSCPSSKTSKFAGFAGRKKRTKAPRWGNGRFMKETPSELFKEPVTAG